MDTSVFIARIFAICYLVIGAGFLINRKAFEGVMRDYCKNAALVFFSGLFALVIGTVIILTHNIWSADWRVIITFVGWAGFGKGVWLIIFPDSVSRFMKLYDKNKDLMTFHSVIALIFGAVLAYFGFFK